MFDAFRYAQNIIKNKTFLKKKTVLLKVFNYVIIYDKLSGKLSRFGWVILQYSFSYSIINITRRNIFHIPKMQFYVRANRSMQIFHWSTLSLRVERGLHSLHWAVIRVNRLLNLEIFYFKDFCRTRRKVFEHPNPLYLHGLTQTSEYKSVWIRFTGKSRRVTVGLHAVIITHKHGITCECLGRRLN